MLQLRDLILLFFATLALSTLAIAQDTPVGSRGCESSLIDSGQPPLVITFDHIETSPSSNGKKVNVYWLKLRNNTKCKIGLEAVDAGIVGPRIARDEAGQFIRNSNGGFKIEYGDSLHNGAIAPVIYHIFNTRQKSIGGNIGGCIVTSTFIRPNYTAVFRVASPEFKKDRILSLSYGYEHEQTKTNLTPFAYQARFAYNALPTKAFNAQAVTK